MTLAFLVILMGLVALDYYAFPYGAAPAGQTLHTRTNGLWVRYTHYFGEKSDAELTSLCQRLQQACGFDGIQWDYEICDDGDPYLLALLDETRAALPKEKVLAVAAPMWFPLRAFGWSEDYFVQVAARCDQIAVMCYDTGMLLPRAYVALTTQNVVHVTRAVARGNPACQVLLGVPTYGKGLLSHNPRAENIDNALRAARQGLADPRAHPEIFAGVALFADYTTDAHEWQIYETLWKTPTASTTRRRQLEKRGEVLVAPGERGTP